MFAMNKLMSAWMKAVFNEKCHNKKFYCKKKKHLKDLGWGYIEKEIKKNNVSVLHTSEKYLNKPEN